MLAAATRILHAFCADDASRSGFETPWRNKWGPFPHNAPPARDQRTKTRSAPTGFRVRRNLLIPQPVEARKAVPAHGLCTGRQAPGPRTSRSIARGDINFILNAEPGSFRDPFRFRPRPLAPRRWRGASSMAKHAFEHAVKLGAEALLRLRQDPGGARNQRSWWVAVVLRQTATEPENSP